MPQGNLIRDVEEDKIREGNSRPMRPQRKIIFPVNRSVRLSTTISRDLNDLADTANKHTSELIREAVQQFVRFHIENPGNLERTL